MNRDWGGAVWVGPTGKWGSLDVEGLRLQSHILELYERFFETITVLLDGLPADAHQKLEESDGDIRKVLEQSELSWLRTIDEARDSAQSALSKQCALRDRLHDDGGGIDVFLPDTNALLHNTNLERWEFPTSTKFELVLLPSILVELDELKVNHRNPDVRAKAEGLISRIKGYRARGHLTQGVPLQKPVSSIRAIATEPRLGRSLPWLDAGNRDDRFIASAIEVIRQQPRSAVVMVTRDINLQSKAELASLPFAEPPDPAALSDPGSRPKPG